MKLILSFAISCFAVSAFAQMDVTAGTYYSRVAAAYDLAGLYEFDREANHTLKAGRCFEALDPNHAIPSALVHRDFGADAGPIADPVQRRIATRWNPGAPADYFDHRSSADLNIPRSAFAFYSQDLALNAAVSRSSTPDGDTVFLRQDDRFVYQLISNGAERIYCYYFVTNLLP